MQCEDDDGPITKSQVCFPLFVHKSCYCGMKNSFKLLFFFNLFSKPRYCLLQTRVLVNVLASVVKQEVYADNSFLPHAFTEAKLQFIHDLIKKQVVISKKKLWSVECHILYPVQSCSSIITTLLLCCFFFFKCNWRLPFPRAGAVPNILGARWLLLSTAIARLQNFPNALQQQRCCTKGRNIERT